MSLVAKGVDLEFQKDRNTISSYNVSLFGEKRRKLAIYQRREKLMK